jgi:hypothetical protein
VGHCLGWICAQVPLGNCLCPRAHKVLPAHPSTANDNCLVVGGEVLGSIHNDGFWYPYYLDRVGGLYSRWHGKYLAISESAQEVTGMDSFGS